MCVHILEVELDGFFVHMRVIVSSFKSANIINLPKYWNMFVNRRYFHSFSCQKQIDKS